MLMLMSLLPASAMAAQETWANEKTAESGTINGVELSADTTLTIPDGVTLTVNNGINTNGHTLTVNGDGTLNVNGANGTKGSTPGYSGDWNGNPGGNGQPAFTGNIIIDGTAVNIIGGTGGTGGYGGYGVSGSVTVKTGTIKITGDIGAGAFSGCTKLQVYAPAGGTTADWCEANGVLFIAE